MRRARDWQAPRREKLLEINAALLRLYLDASETLEITRYRERAAEVLRYVQTWLADPVDGGWAGSQHADRSTTSGASRHGALGRARDRRRALRRWNASMASAALRASAALDDTALGEFALKSLERVLIGCYTPGAGVAHYVERPAVGARPARRPGLRWPSAQLDAYDATGNIVYEMMAQELAHYAVRTMWDERDGGFFDRSIADERTRIGRMRDRLQAVRDQLRGRADAAPLPAVTG